MKQRLLELYNRYQILLLFLVCAVVLTLSFLQVLPGAYHAGSMGEYHVFAYNEYRYSNIMSNFTNREFPMFDKTGYLTPGIEYPALMSMLYRLTTMVALSGHIGTYMWLNFAILLPVGLLVLFLIMQWPEARPWMYAASPVLFLFAFYNLDLIAIAFMLGGLFLLRASTQRVDPGRGYNLLFEVGGFTLLTMGTWFKLFPIVFFGAAIIERARRREWRAAGLGVALFVILSIVINVPAMLIDFEGWAYFFRLNQHRSVEPTVWYLIFGGGQMMPGLMIEQHTIDIVNMASPILAVLGGLAITALAWFSRRRDIMVVTGSLLLVWWLSINKIYDPNFDIWVLIVVAVLGAPFWLNVAFAMMSMFWYFIAFEGLHYTLTRGAEAAVVWHIQHPLYVALILRLVVFAALLGWLVIKLREREPQTPGRETLEEAPEVGQNELRLQPEPPLVLQR